jgi:hypothetical protein
MMRFLMTLCHQADFTGYGIILGALVALLVNFFDVRERGIRHWRSLWAVRWALALGYQFCAAYAPHRVARCLPPANITIHWSLIAGVSSVWRRLGHRRVLPRWGVPALGTLDPAVLTFTGAMITGMIAKIVKSKLQPLGHTV